MMRRPGLVQLQHTNDTGAAQPTGYDQDRRVIYVSGFFCYLSPRPVTFAEIAEGAAGMRLPSFAYR